MHVHIAPDVVERRIDDVGARAPLPGARARRLPAEVALHVDGRARARSCAASSPGSRSRRGHAQPRRRGDEPARGRDRRARGRADRVAARPSTRVNETAGRTSSRPAPRCRCGCACSANCATHGRRTSSRWRSSTTTGALLPETRDVLDASRATAWCSPPATSAATRSSRSSTPPSRRACATIVVTHPEFPVAGHRRRRPGRAGRQGRAAGALLHHAAHRQGARGSACSRRSAPPAPSARCSPPTSARSSTRPSRTGSPLMADRLLEAGLRRRRRSTRWR